MLEFSQKSSFVVTVYFSYQDQQVQSISNTENIKAIISTLILKPGATKHDISVLVFR